MAVYRHGIRMSCLTLVAVTCGAAVGGVRRMEVEPGAKTVGKYARIEFVIRTNGEYANPYDPGEVDVSLEITAPGGRRVVVPGFYYQHFERRRVERRGKKVQWLHPVGEAQWRVRFAPGVVGMHSCVARLTDRRGTVRSGVVKFECVASKSDGYVRVSRTDPRFFEFSSGRAFFAVGQNVAFIRDTYVAGERFAKLAANGANFVRVWACCKDWAMSIEPPKSVWTRTWLKRSPVVVLPGKEGKDTARKCVRIAAGDREASLLVSPCHAVTVRPSTQYVLSGRVQTKGAAAVEVRLQGRRTEERITAPGKWVRFERRLTSSPDQVWGPRISFHLAGQGEAWVRDVSLKQVGGGPELLWEADVDRPTRAWCNQVDCFMLDKVVEAAEASGLYIELVPLVRDHYMDALKDPASAAYQAAVADAKKVLRYAVARWGYSTAVAAWEYFNEMHPGLPTDAFYQACGEYLERIDPYGHIRANSTWSPSAKDWRHAKLDMADTHYYMRPARGELFQDAAAAVLARATAMRKVAAAKPAMLSEFGMLSDQGRDTPHLARDKGYVHMHNALWASAMSGLSGTILHWFWDDIDKRDMYHHYRGVSAFVADIPFTTAKLRAADASSAGGEVRIVGLQGDGCAYLWICNRQATWWKLSAAEARGEPQELRGVSVTLKGMRDGGYRVQWWDTREGRVIGRAAVTSSAKRVRLAVPAFSRDIACKVVRNRRGAWEWVACARLAATRRGALHARECAGVGCMETFC